MGFRAFPRLAALFLAAAAAAAVAVSTISVFHTASPPVALEGVRMRQAMAIAGPRQSFLALNNVWELTRDTPLEQQEEADKLFFECDGEAHAQLCMISVNKCIETADAEMANLYKVDPRLATESRPDKLCACFRSNGCKPSCNVQMYVLWSTESQIQCPASPPTFVESAGVFNYGDPLEVQPMPSDISYQYFPSYPNPAGHRYYGPVPDYEYRMPEFYDHRYNMGPEDYYTAPRFAPSDASSPYWYSRGQGPNSYWASPYDFRLPARGYYYAQPQPQPQIQPQQAFPGPQPEAKPSGNGWLWDAVYGR